MTNRILALLAALALATSALAQTALTTTNVPPTNITGAKTFAQDKLCIAGGTSGTICFRTSAVAGTTPFNIGTGGTLGTAAFTASSGYQPVDADLTAVSALSTTAYGRAFLELANAGAGRTYLGLATVAASGSAADLGSGTLPAARLPALTGDITTTAGTVATTLASVVTGASCTNCNLTYDAKGRITVGANGSGGTGYTAPTGTGFAHVTTGVQDAVAVGETGTSTVVRSTSPTISSPVITNIAPGADFTLTQNSVVPFTSVNTGAVVDTLYLKNGNAGFGTTAPLAPIDVRVTQPNLSQPTGMANGAGLDAHTAMLIAGWSASQNTKVGLQFSPYAGIYSIGGIFGLTTNYNSNTLGDITFDLRRGLQDASLTEAMRVTSQGNVWIGVSTSNWRLHVEDTLDQRVAYVKNSNATFTNSVLMLDTAKTIGTDFRLMEAYAGGALQASIRGDGQGYFAGGVNVGTAGTVVGKAVFSNSGAGTITVQPPVAGALGTVTLTLPAATDTLVGKATTDTLTNKTLISSNAVALSWKNTAGISTNVLQKFSDDEVYLDNYDGPIRLRAGASGAVGASVLITTGGHVTLAGSLSGVAANFSGAVGLNYGLPVVTLTNTANTGNAGMDFRNAGGVTLGGFFNDTATGNSFINAYATTNALVVQASSANVGMGTATPDAAALLDVSSTVKGFLPPRMTTTQRDAISSPPSGLIIFNTTTGKLNVRGVSAWEAVTSS